MLTLEELAALAAAHAEELQLQVREFDINGREFCFNSRPAIMGVINLSPGSWLPRECSADYRGGA